MTEGLTVEKLRYAKKLLQEAEDRDNERFDRDLAHWLATGKCIEHRIVVAVGGFVLCAICMEEFN